MVIPFDFHLFHGRNYYITGHREKLTTNKNRIFLWHFVLDLFHWREWQKMAGSAIMWTEKQQFPNQSPCFPSVSMPYTALRIFLKHNLAKSLHCLKYTHGSPEHTKWNKFFRMPSKQSCSWLSAQENWKHTSTQRLIHAYSLQLCL